MPLTDCVLEQVDVTGKIATLVIVGSAFGEMTIPWIIAERMDGRPEAFIGGIAAAVVGSVVVFVWFWIIGNRKYPTRLVSRPPACDAHLDPPEMLPRGLSNLPSL